MKTDSADPDPWMMEDVQLRCELAAERWAAALTHAKTFGKSVPESLSRDFGKAQSDLAGLRRRAVTYALHLRETNLALVLRKAKEMKQPLPEKSLAELREALTADLENYRVETSGKDWPEMQQAIDLLGKNPDEFLQKYFAPGPDQMSKGIWSITSR
jgi:hypothetical protein